MPSIPSTFRDANYNQIPYDGSPIEWRVSLYGICVTKEHLLLVKHEAEKYWDIPGGGIEMGESLPEALARESQEEAGWQLTPLQPVFACGDWFFHSEKKQFYRSLQLFWLAQGEKILDKPTDPRITEVKLVAMEELASYPIYPNVVAALTEAKKLKLI